MGVKRLHARPRSHDRIVVRMRDGLLVDVVAHCAVLLHACLGKVPDHGPGDVAEHGQEVDVLHHVERTAGWFRPNRTRREGVQDMLIGRAVADGFQRPLELRRRHRLLVRVKRRQVLPAFDHDEAVGPAQLLEDSELDISRLMAAGFTVLLKQLDTSAL